MAKASYSEEEVRQIARALAREKNKSSQFEEFKRVLFALKKKHDQVLLELKEKEDLTVSFQQQAEIHRELTEENQLLCQQITLLKQALADLPPETATPNPEAEKELLKTREALQESKRHGEQLERVIQFLRERSEEAHLELAQLRNDYQILQSSANQHDTIQKGLQTHTEKLESFEQEIVRIKQTLMRAVRESQELANHYQAVVEEKVALTGKWRQALHQIEKEREQASQHQAKLESMGETNCRLREQVAHWQQQCENDKQKAAAALVEQNFKIEQEQALVHAREETVVDLQRQIGILRHEGEKTRDELAQLRLEISDKEEELTQAHQHLARKVKEATELEDKKEAQNKQIQELQQIIQDNRIKIAELQASDELREQQQRRSQEQLQEAIKAYETQQIKWEDKYLALYDKCQNAEARVKELGKQEERYMQLQGLLSHVGNYLNPAPPPEIPPPPAPKVPPPKIAEEPIEVEKSYSSLFETPRASRPKKNLLD